MAHFSFTSLFQIGLFLILICWTTKSTGASFSLEEEFKQFKVKLCKLFYIQRVIYDPNKNVSFRFHAENKIMSITSLFEIWNSNLAIDSNERNC